MRRLPIYFLIDVSESMVGDPITQVEDGMRGIIQELRQDPYALETVYISIIGFASQAHTLSPLEELYKFYPPKFPIGDGTSLGVALEYLMHDFDAQIKPTTLEAKGDFKPIIFLFTDGTPTDNYTQAFKKWNATYRKKCTLVAVGIGQAANTQILGQISDNVLLLHQTDPKSFTEFFKWVTASVKTSSMSVTNYGTDEPRLAPTHGINLEKVDKNAPCQVDEQYVVLLAKCSLTNQEYLIKFGKQIFNQGQSNNDCFYFLGSYPIDPIEYAKFSSSTGNNQLINSDKIRGVPTCPYCGSQNGIIFCENCKKISCFVEHSSTQACPWCGASGEIDLSYKTFDINRERG